MIERYTLKVAPAVSQEELLKHSQNGEADHGQAEPVAGDCAVPQKRDGAFSQKRLREIVRPAFQSRRRVARRPCGCVRVARSGIDRAGLGTAEDMVD